MIRTKWFPMPIFILIPMKIDHESRRQNLKIAPKGRHLPDTPILSGFPTSPIIPDHPRYSRFKSDHFQSFFPGQSVK